MGSIRIQGIDRAPNTQRYLNPLFSSKRS